MGNNFHDSAQLSHVAWSRFFSSDARCNNIVPKQQLQNCSEMMGTSDPCSMQHEVQVKMSQVVTQGESICLRDFF